MTHKNTFFKILFLTLFLSLSGGPARAQTEVSKILATWSPKGREAAIYKRYFEALNSRSSDQFWLLYQDLSKSKKLLKLQHDSIKKMLEYDLERKESATAQYKNFDKIAKRMLKNLRGQPEGLEYELSYLKWIVKNKKFKELCSVERQRWLSQNELTLEQVEDGLSTCPMSYSDFLYRIRLLIFSGEEPQARTEIEAYNKKHNLSDWEEAYLQAVFYTNIGDPVSAFKKLSRYEKELRQNQDYFLNYFFIAQRAGEQEKAEQIINQIMKGTTSVGRLTELKQSKAHLFYQTKRYKEANVIFGELVKQHRSHKRKIKSNEYDDLTWLRAWTSYLSGNYEQANREFTQNLKWTRDKARTQYWLARTELARGNTFKALELLRVLATPVLQGRFFNYYNYLAWQRFEQNKNTVVSDLMKTEISRIRSGKGAYLIPDTGTKPRELLAQYESYVEIAETTDQGGVAILNQDNDILESSDTEGIKVQSSEALQNELAWADRLTAWGYRDMAKWHLYEVEKNLKTKTDVLPLAQYYLNNRHYNRAVQLMQKVTNPTSKKLHLSEEETLWRSLFPKAYADKLTEEAKKNKINPYLVWAIMKAETQFKADAISPVGAVGLMQFMPYTSKKVAQLLKKDFDDEKLFDPHVAVQYGARYIRKLSDELGGQTHLIAAAYNGGPHRVKLWLRNLKNDKGPAVESDVFIEHIPFSETRTYVKRVLNFYLAYQKLYEEKYDFKSAKWLTESLAYNIQEPISLKEEWPAPN